LIVSSLVVLILMIQSLEAGSSVATARARSWLQAVAKLAISWAKLASQLGFISASAWAFHC